MLNKIRNFSNTKAAGVLVAILIVPFVLWGMGGLFSGGNKNNIAKINKENISTKDLQDHLILSNIDSDCFKYSGLWFLISKNSSLIEFNSAAAA